MAKGPAKPVKPPPAKPEKNLYGKALDLVELVRPHCVLCFGLLATLRGKVAPYASDEELVKVLCGVIITFFGARYMATIAAFEAFRMVGWSTSKRCLLKLYDNYLKAVEASVKDDAVDADADGFPDVAQIPLEQLLARKGPLVLKSIDPESVSEAMGGLYAGMAAVLATLRVRFAATITLGATLGDVAADALKTPVTALASKALADEHAKFVPLLVVYGSRMAGVSLAFALQRFAVAAHSAARGSQLLADGLLAVFVRAGYLPSTQADDPQLRSALQLALAVTGVFTQFYHGFGVPFPLNVFLLPLSLFESLLVAIVGI